MQIVTYPHAVLCKLQKVAARNTERIVTSSGPSKEDSQAQTSPFCFYFLGAQWSGEKAFLYYPGTLYP